MLGYDEEEQDQQERPKRWDDEVKKLNKILKERDIQSAITEIYSPSRVNGVAGKLRLIPGTSLDLTTTDENGDPWDFNVKSMRDKAEKIVRSKGALLLIGSPMCTAFSQLQNINFSRLNPEDVKAVIEYGTTHLEFCMKLYKIQAQQGRYFLHEHPAGATSWKNEKVKELLDMKGVEKVIGHMCAFGMIQEDEQGEALIKKPTAFMGNCDKVLKR